MIEFEVKGPWRVPYVKKAGGRTITKENGIEFFEKFSEVKYSKGIYVFGFQMRGLIPVYVGKSKISFKDEVFTNDKLHKYGEALLDYQNDWKPIMFFVIHPSQKGKTNNKAINAIETFLIELASQRNDKLKNIQKNNKEDLWSIKGVFKNSQGQPPTEAKLFKQMIGL